MSDTKLTNPKDLIGSKKLPTHLVPASMMIYACMAFAEGASKYGAHNWRVAGIRLSVYKSAHDRHMEKFWNGERCDPKTGVPHLASALACIAIMIDAELCGMVTDDRPPAADMARLIEEAEAVISNVVQLNAHLNPKHFSIADSKRPAKRKKVA